MSQVGERQEFTFQAEIHRLLGLLANSLYQGKEIALRELVSNASDSLDKMRFIALSNPEQRTDEPLEIVLSANKDTNELTIQDNGIGMTRDELVKNLGSIAHSGSVEFLTKLAADQKADLSLIGQFGVGFYSSFMLAEEVRVKSRSYQEDQGWIWTSNGAGKFAIEPAGESLPRGVSIVLKLKEDCKSFLEEYMVKSAIKRYSRFVPHPIKWGAEVINDQKPIWVEPKSQLTEDQYTGFFHHLTHSSNDKPLWTLHFTVDSPIQFHALLYSPATNLELMGFGRMESGLSLLAKRVLVQGNCKELLPEYLRFVVGIVDSADLPLNVSRETLQDNSVFRKIRSVLVKRVLDRMIALADEDPKGYLTFYRLFSQNIKEGIHTDYENRARLLKLLRLSSTAMEDPEQPTTLDAYIARSPAEQKLIYVVGAPNLDSAKRNPGLEQYRKHGIEVLYLLDPVDEIVVANAGQYDGRDFVFIDSAEAKLPDGKTAEPSPSVNSASFNRLLDLFRLAVGAQVEEVKGSQRLTDSPCCLVTPEGMPSAGAERLMRAAQRDLPPTKRIFEVNPDSSLIQRLAELTSNPANEAFLKLCAEQLHADALALSGQLPSVSDWVQRSQELMLQAAQNKAVSE